MSIVKPTLAFFGATGDCAGYCLAAALRSGHDCVALARTPAKLETAMKSKGVTVEELTRLKVVQGDVRDEASVLAALSINSTAVDTIVSGIGSLPALQWSLSQPVTLRDPSICEDATNVLMKALDKLQFATAPLLIVVSTTGIEPAGKPQDIPLAYSWLYRWLLHVPHVDKAKMETLLRSVVELPISSSPIRGYIAVKPTLLMDGNGIGVDKVRAGTEDEPAIGYTIRRQDVGQWTYEKLISQEVPSAWLNKGICLTS